MLINHYVILHEKTGGVCSKYELDLFPEYWITLAYV